ncbi:heterokaryon incompatibility protein-domain-containing protein [Lasiosphaeria hispida]|uniref:Heterokaryon incompatibility protein-domain-containing protein n=1 Tax=Lasiosphaeria hispida TaxID=260671 RepID=A0AAJ0HPA5_9PEZI|nr:heterokaryon incompatibility protein-domain-containing protein [Lasiosphaeria hispida]
MQSSVNLCSQCLPVLQILPDVPYTPIHCSYPNLTFIQQSKCALCRLLSFHDWRSSTFVASPRKLVTGSIRVMWTIERDVNDDSSTKYQAALVWDIDAVRYPEDGSETMPAQLRGGPFHLFICPDDMLVKPDGTWNRTTISREPLTDTSLNLIHGWIEDCLANHPQCNEKHFPNVIPSRLIDVGPSDGTQEPRLCEGPVQGQYIALSHCWGGSLPVQTTSSNIVQHKKSLPFSTLPKTFQDAVTFTRRLGIQYLWIDSLCIIQDSASDWRLESSKMAGIYGNALLSLAATLGVNSHSGFLSRTKDGVAPIPIVPLAADGLPESEQNFWLYTFPTPKTWEAEVAASRWNGRGWTLQERLLSPRMLHVCSQQHFWECQTTTLAEGGRIGDSTLGDDSRVDERHFKRLLGDANVIPTPGPVHNYQNPELSSHMPDKPLTEKENAFLRWHQIVVDFTARSLTKQSDKLVALAGLSEAWKSLVHDEYLAGLWRSDLTRGLLWQADRGRHAARLNTSRPSYHRAPSWSWASLDGEVYKYYMRDFIHIQEEVGRRPAFVLDCNLHEKQVATADGPVSSTVGWLRIVAQCKSYRKLKKLEQDWIIFYDVETTDASIKWKRTLVVYIATWHGSSIRPLDYALLLYESEDKSRGGYKRIAFLRPRDMEPKVRGWESREVLMW